MGKAPPAHICCLGIKETKGYLPQKSRHPAQTPRKRIRGYAQLLTSFKGLFYILGRRGEFNELVPLRFQKLRGQLSHLGA